MPLSGPAAPGLRSRDSRQLTALALLLAAGLLPGCRAGSRGDEARARPAAAAPLAAMPSEAAAPARLLGRWQRSDADYILQIDAAAPDGAMTARYFNPGPIRVGRAGWARSGERIVLSVELRDEGYPGSYYELAFDPASDSLDGVYHHLGIGQDFDVVFTRLAPETE